MKKKLLALILSLVMALSLAACGGDTAQTDSTDQSSNASGEATSNWPSSSVEVLVPASPGGGTDLTLRSLLLDISKSGDFAVVNNIDGGGAVAISELAGSDPKQLNKIMFFNGSLFVSYNVGLFDEEPLVDLLPVWTATAAGSYCVIVPADSPFNSIADVKAYAEEHPGELQFGASLGDFTHLLGVQLANELGIDWTYVATGSDADRIPLIMGHNLDITIINGITAENYLTDDSVKAISLVHGRDDSMSEKMQAVETLEEAGYDYLVNMPLIVWVPAGTSDADMNRINELFTKSLDNPEVQESLAKLNMVLTAQGDLEDVQTAMKEYSEQIYEACSIAGMTVR